MVDKNKVDLQSKYAKYAKMLPPEEKAFFQNKGTSKVTQEQKIKEAQRTGKKVEVVSKAVGNKQNQISNIGKLLDEDVEIKEIPKEISTQVSRARNDHKFSQEQLAKKISEPVAVINDLEKGEGIYNPKVVEKIEKALDVKFTRSWKKSK